MQLYVISLPVGKYLSYDKWLHVIMRRYPQTYRNAEAGINDRDKQLHPTDTVWCNYLPVPLIPAYYVTSCTLVTASRSPHVSHVQLYVISLPAAKCVSHDKLLYVIMQQYPKHTRPDTVGCNHLSLPLISTYYITSCVGRILYASPVQLYVISLPAAK